MAAIDRIEGSAGIYEAQPVARKRSGEAATASSRNMGADTVSLSDEALRKAGYDTGEESGTEAADNKQEKQTSLAQKASKSFFAMLMESLFLAELEEAGAGSQTPQNASGEDPVAKRDVSEKHVNPLQDGEKVAALKQLISDVMTGKADISDLPKAMAVGKGGGESQPASVAKSAKTSSQGKSGDDKETAA